MHKQSRFGSLCSSVLATRPVAIRLLLLAALGSSLFRSASAHPNLHALSDRAAKLTNEKGQTSNAGVEQERLKLESDKLAFEEKLEAEKVELEKRKLESDEKAGRWSALTSIVPLLVAFGTLAFSVWSFRSQGQRDVELKAAEFAFQGKTPEALKNRCEALKKIFGSRLPHDFGGSFNPAEHGGGKEDSEGKKLFLELLLKYPSQREELVHYWRQLFGDKWLDRIFPSSRKTED